MYHTLVMKQQIQIDNTKKRYRIQPEHYPYIYVKFIIIQINTVYCKGTQLLILQKQNVIATKNGHLVNYFQSLGATELEGIVMLSVVIEGIVMLRVDLVAGVDYETQSGKCGKHLHGNQNGGSS